MITFAGPITFSKRHNARCHKVFGILKSTFTPKPEGSELVSLDQHFAAFSTWGPRKLKTVNVPDYIAK